MLSFLFPILPHLKCMWRQTRRLSVTSFPIHLALCCARTTPGSGLGNDGIVPEMEGGRLEPGWSPVGHRGRDPARAGTLDWPQAYASQVYPIPPNTHSCAYGNIFKSLRIRWVHLWLNPRCKMAEIYYWDFSPFDQGTVFGLCGLTLRPLHSIKSPSRERTDHFASLGSS